jgi:hypothetical protein
VLIMVDDISNRLRNVSRKSLSSGLKETKRLENLLSLANRKQFSTVKCKSNVEIKAHRALFAFRAYVKASENLSKRSPDKSLGLLQRPMLISRRGLSCCDQIFMSQ